MDPSFPSFLLLSPKAPRKAPRTPSVTRLSFLGWRQPTTPCQWVTPRLAPACTPQPGQARRRRRVGGQKRNDLWGERGRREEGRKEGRPCLLMLGSTVTGRGRPRRSLRPWPFRRHQYLLYRRQFPVNPISVTTTIIIMGLSERGISLVGPAGRTKERRGVHQLN